MTTAPTAAGTPSEKDRRAVVDLLGELTAAWNAGDASAYAALFTVDAEYVAFNGSRMAGREGIEQVHRFLFEGPLKGSRLGTEGTTDDATDGSGLVSLRLVRPDVAIAVSEGGTTLADAEAPSPDRDSIITTVCVREADRWRIATFQNTRRTAG